MQAQFHLQPQHNQHISTEHAANFQQQPPPTMQTLRLRDNVVTPASTSPRASRKRKSPDTPSTEEQPTPLPPHMRAMPPNPYAAGPADFSPSGMPPPHPGPPGAPGDTDSQQESDGQSRNRPLSQSKRAEQNRKAQRAFRERRDAHVKSLESRSQLLDSALASADEANRKWQECRDLVDQLRIENQQLRAALAPFQSMHPGIVAPPTVHLPPHLLTQSPRVPSADGNPNDEENEKRP